MQITPGTAAELFPNAYDTYADAIFRHCYFRVFDRERAKEILQEVFVKTWEYLRRGNTVDNMQAFLYRTANNLIVDEARRAKKRTVDSLETLQEEGFDISSEENVEEESANRLDAADVASYFSRIEEPYREALILRFVNDIPPAEIADLLGISANVASVRIHRGMQKLRSLLEDA